MTPMWVAGRPRFLPEEFYWLVGVTHRGFPDNPGEVRNTFGSNISFRREVFHELGGFDVEIGGRKGERNLQGGETELAARLRAKFHQGVFYVPNAVVAHKVFDYRTRPWWLLNRAFWQGYSKRIMAEKHSRSELEERTFLLRLIIEFVPARIHRLLSSRSMVEFQQFIWLWLFVGAVAIGYFYAIIKNL
jgi:hypothetical protein